MAPAAGGPVSPDDVVCIKLLKGNSLYSPGGAFRFTLQLDGNAAVQCVNDATLPRQWTTGAALNATTDVQWVPITSFQSQDSGVTEVDMQLDGNLVGYNGAGVAFQSGTPGPSNPGVFLRMQDDGNLVIYNPDGSMRWMTGTNARGK
jgi:hypothetical protein